ncbi:protein-disulfide reductase DsbD family protein [Gallaecimonas kandeliae]|uniref:TlpA family protein disulfide reductase n=1 Tax=Gallaecimonas kandeliae TaxID=3029055 RepID=UPI0026491BBA|nr:protein-disulfide reductase DsbD domain-containing protein [Gallaecimonas kandeliae]WKE65203.1 protein-disulfide reductase DsbD family protein [Gallaecimonas kandeliae]
MTFWQRLLAALCICSSAAALAQDRAYQDIPLTRFSDQQQVTLASLPQDRPTYIKFWASWCKPCMAQMPHFEHAYQQYKDKLNLVALNININEEPAQIRKVVQRFGLKMPLWLDEDGALGVALGLVGTPYSLLFDRQGRLVYSTHEADAELDQQLALLAAGKASPPVAMAALDNRASAGLLAPWQQGEHLLFFTATWCDWYLKDSRPAMAQRCSRAQQGLNSLAARLPNRPWQVLVNNLWTDDKSVQEFRDKFGLRQPIQVDEQGLLFNHFAVRDIPALLWVKDGKVLARITDFDDQAAVASQLSAVKPVFLKAGQAFKLSSQRDADQLVLTWDIADGYYLYQDQLQVRVNGALVSPSLPKALSHQDPYFGTSHIYRHRLSVKVPLKAGDQLAVRYRGCADGGLCYPPTSQTLL